MGEGFWKSPFWNSSFSALQSFCIISWKIFLCMICLLDFSYYIFVILFVNIFVQSKKHNMYFLASLFIKFIIC
jgi:hypothetical protein